VVGHVQQYLQRQIDQMPQPMMRLFSLKNDFPNVFYQLMHGDSQSTVFSIGKNHFPYLFAGKNLRVEQTQLLLKRKAGLSSALTTPSTINVNGTSLSTGTTASSLVWNDFFSPAIKITNLALGNFDPVREWRISFDSDTGANGLHREQVEDVMVLVTFKTV